MQHILRDMLIWMLTFFGISATVLFLVRIGVSRFRRRRAERLRLLDVRLREGSDGLGLPVSWSVSTRANATPADRFIGAFGWILALAFASAGMALTVLAGDGKNWTMLAIGGGISFWILVLFSAWLYCRRSAAVPPKSRHLAEALRWWAIRIAAGIELHQALEQSARQLQPFDPELARCLEMASVSGTDQHVVQPAFYPFGSGVAERLVEIVTGKVTDVVAALRNLADRIDASYQDQLLIRAKRIERWLKYPVVLCLVPAINLVAFGPAITDLIRGVGIVKAPAIPAARDGDQPADQTSPESPEKPIE